MDDYVEIRLTKPEAKWLDTLLSRGVEAMLAGADPDDAAEVRDEALRIREALPV